MEFDQENLSQKGENGIRIQSILNRVQLHSGFVYGTIRWSEKPGRQALEVEIRPRRGSRPVCSRCGQICPGYDTQRQRQFEFVPLWEIAVFFLYAMRRVGVPWAEGKKHLTTTYAWFLAGWAKFLSWLKIAKAFQNTWDNVFRAVQMAVDWGLAHRDLDNVAAIGTDEICWCKKKEKFVTLVYQLDTGRRRLLWIGRNRTAKTFRSFFDWFSGRRNVSGCSDMWRPYLKVLAEKAPGAVNVLDRFHVMRHMNKAIDDIRAKETKTLKAKGKEPVLTGSRC